MTLYLLGTLEFYNVKTESVCGTLYVSEKCYTSYILFYKDCVYQ